jgi:PKD repeat protein
MNTASMTRWPHLGLLGLIAVLLTVCITPGCRKKEDNASASAAQRAASPSLLTPRSHLLVEEVAHATPTPVSKKAENEKAENEDEEAREVSVSATADPSSGGAPLTVSFSAEVSDAPAGVQYRWDFGDHSQSSGRLEVQHTYTSAGEYTATFSVNGSGVDELQEVDIEVTEEGFDLDVNADPDIGTAPLNVEFTAMLDEDLPEPVLFQWDFGDGGRDFSNPAHHTYRQPGQYTATLLVTNGLGQVARRELEIQVDPREVESE